MSGFAALALVLFSGLHGIVTRGPTTPVCKVGVRCSAPAVGAVLVFSRVGHKAVRVRTGAGGHYSVRLAPGSYTVQVSPSPRIGTGIRPAHVHVARNVDARLDFSIDTGIR
ncbi:MAG: hypothetical protein ACXVRQ_04585 [Gaiellaceae bacterium]